MRKKTIFIFSILVGFVGLAFLASLTSFAQVIEGQTKDGRQVLLYPDGTWAYKGDLRKSLPSSEQKVENKGSYPTIYGRFKVHLDPNIWEKRTNDSTTTNKGRMEFDFKGEPWASIIVIPEEKSGGIAALKTAVLNNLKNVSEDTQIVFERVVKVNNQDVSHLKIVGTLKDSKVGFVYYGYYYAGSAGTIQLVCMTSQASFNQFKPHFDKVLQNFEIY